MSGYSLFLWGKTVIKIHSKIKFCGMVNCTLQNQIPQHTTPSFFSSFSFFSILWLSGFLRATGPSYRHIGKFLFRNILEYFLMNWWILWISHFFCESVPQPLTGEPQWLRIGRTQNYAKWSKMVQRKMADTDLTPVCLTFFSTQIFFWNFE